MHIRYALATLTLAAALSNAAAATSPNIVLIMADDMGFSDIGCYGGEINTPNLDRLADGGLRFTQFYNTGRCCPTRAALLTGLYPHQAGIGHMVGDHGRPAYRGRLGQHCVTIAEALAPGGYRSMVAGKWHVTPFDYNTRKASHQATWPLQRGFDTFYGTLAGGGSYFNPPGLTRGNDPIKPFYSDYYYTDAVSDEAAKFVRSFDGKPDPFFLYVAYTCPHWPLHAGAADVAKYKDVYDKGWDAVRQERLRRMVKMKIIDAGCKLTPRDPVAPPWQRAKNKPWQAARMAVYAAQVDAMDQGIGRIVDALKTSGRLDNTLIMFLADNGGCAEVLQRGGWLERIGIVDRPAPDGRPMHVGNDPAVSPGGPDTFASYGVGWANASNTPFRLYKHWVHEGGIASPLIVHWPDGFDDRGQLRRQPAHVVDLMATCVDVAGIEYPREHDGREITPPEGKSLVPALRGLPTSRGPIFWEHEGNRAVRDGQWKLVARHGRPWELYDMKADRSETNNLIVKNPDRAKAMIAQYEAWAGRCGVEPWPPKQAGQK